MGINGGAAAAGPLSWLRVVDLTDLRGAMCARILADLGADVVRVEQGSGAPDEASLADAYRNANKQRIDLDLARDRDRARLSDLLDEADVLVENLRAEQRDALGLAPDAVSATHPHLVHVVLADLGLSGPRSSWHLEALPALAASGALYASGFPELPPCNAPGHLAHDCASVYGAIGAVAGVLDRERRDDGEGQLVEVSVQEAALAGTTPWSIAMQDYLKINPLLPAPAPATRRARTGCCRRRTAGCAWSSVPSVSGTGSSRSWVRPTRCSATSGSTPDSASPTPT